MHVYNTLCRQNRIYVDMSYFFKIVFCHQFCRQNTCRQQHYYQLTHLVTPHWIISVKNFMTDALASLWSIVTAAMAHCKIDGIAADCMIASGHLWSNLHRKKCMGLHVIHLHIIKYMGLICLHWNKCMGLINLHRNNYMGLTHLHRNKYTGQIHLDLRSKRLIPNTKIHT